MTPQISDERIAAIEAPSVRNAGLAPASNYFSVVRDKEAGPRIKSGVTVIWA